MPQLAAHDPRPAPPPPLPTRCSRRAANQEALASALEIKQTLARIEREVVALHKQSKMLFGTGRAVLAAPLPAAAEGEAGTVGGPSFNGEAFVKVRPFTSATPFLLNVCQLSVL